MSELWQTVLGIIATVGGASVLIWAVVKFSANRLADLLSQKYQAKLDQELETFKGELEKQKESFRVKADKTRYVSKVRFDTEFSLCRELMAAAHTMVNDTYFVYPTRTLALESMQGNKEDKWGTATTSANHFLLLLRQNAPFISKEIYHAFLDLHDVCRANLDAYLETPCLRHMSQEAPNHELLRETEAYQRTREFEPRLNAIIEMLREHFAQMDVNE